MQDLCRLAIEAALGAGASYADARAIARRSQLVMTKNGEVETVSDTETEGIGVRVLVDGAWGFACDRRLEEAGARDSAQRAAAFARAAPGSHERELASLEPQSGTYRTDFERDPVDVPLSDKIALCLRADEAMKHDDVKVRMASTRAVREEKVFVSSEGSAVEQLFVDCGAGIDAIAVGDGLQQVRSYPSAHTGSSAQAG
jgi:TldD protein